ncbi:helicase-exonuclease AddAB subunit AddB [Bacillus kwashiorkori]|uniref:helicase-exonuclease AddAB subunit AddB n=1 Tax=Bacillus kwashiorkori TaxID=1522318 RepID=UPI0007837761|nr:helicase-exonuclease AddAB subunit AddB [Bacillus kwashiorkori]
MSVQFILGRSGTGKTTWILNEIVEKLLDQNDETPIFLIVPDQMTFLTEYKLLTEYNITGMTRAQVYSFTRLAWRVFQETGGISRLHLHPSGIRMLLRKIMDDNKEQLKIFHHNADQNGFIEHMENVITEFKHYCITPEMISNQKNDDNLSYALKDKLEDMQLVYQSFQQAIIGKYLASEDYLTLLAAKIPQSKILDNAIFYLDGFHSFTPQEYLVIDKLMSHSQKVTIALNLDRPFRNTVPDELHLFRMTGDTYSTLFDIARVTNKEVYEDIILKNTVRFKNESLAFLENNFENLPVVSYEGEPQITIAQATNRRAEIEGVGRKIISLVRDQNYRYKDIAILVRNVEQYNDLFDTVFTDFQIPYFIDQKRSMLNHPLIELIRSTFEIITGFWRYEPVFRAVKTELLYPLNENPITMREKMDQFENYCIAYGIQGAKWTSKTRWHYRKIRNLESLNYPQTDAEKQYEQEINELRLLISAPINRLANRLKKAETGRQQCEALFLYLEELDIPAKLERLQIQAEEAGNLLASREHEQAWNGVLQLLDQYVEMLGNEKITIKEFSAIMEEGLESLHFSLVPPAIDQVMVANLELSRLSAIKVAFVIGVNDEVLPAKLQDTGILSEEDREKLLVSGLKIAPTEKQRLFDEEFLAYKAFTAAEDYLYITYPIANEEGKALLPSPYVKRIKEMFPNMKLVLFDHEPTNLTDIEQLEFLVNKDKTITYLTGQLQAFKRLEKMEPLWWDSYNFLVNSEVKEQLRTALSSLFFENKPENLSTDTAQQLYGDLLQVSISRVEMFQRDPFCHFLSYGLKLKEREVFRLEAPDIGDMFHGALKQIGEMIEQENLSWAKLTNQQIQKLVAIAIDTLSPKLQNEILLSSNRFQYIKRKLEKIIYRSTLILSEHAKSSGFSPIGMEVSFGGKKADLPSLKFNLNNGAKMELVGRIDRVDKAKTDDGYYLRVIDYKSSKRELDIGEVYYGLTLQMLTYLDILLINAQKLVDDEAKPAGMFYFHIHNPLIKSNTELADDEVEEEIFKRFKMNGLVLSDADVVQLMDQTLQTGESKIISAGLKKDGNLTARSKAVTETDFTNLRKYVHKVFINTGNEILDGKIDLAPYKLKDRTACTFCPFKSICQFDPALRENNYRNLTPLKRTEALNFVKREVETYDGE